MNSPDLFDGIYDNRTTQRREIWQDGELRRYAAKNCTGNPAAVWPELRASWGEFPDVPSNAALAA